jgi:hypothetical protein
MQQQMGMQGGQAQPPEELTKTFNHEGEMITLLEV